MAAAAFDCLKDKRMERRGEGGEKGEREKGGSHMLTLMKSDI